MQLLRKWNYQPLVYNDTTYWKFNVSPNCIIILVKKQMVKAFVPALQMLA